MASVALHPADETLLVLPKFSKTKCNMICLMIKTSLAYVIYIIVFLYIYICIYIQTNILEQFASLN